MDPLYVMLALALLFAGTHVGLATSPVRTRLAGRFGEVGFRVLFFVVASCSFTAVVAYYADHRGLGGAGPALGEVPVLGVLLRGLVGAGFALMVASLAGYPGSPYDLDRPRAVRAPRGLERVTRHPFFAGLAVFATAHALLAPTRMGSALMLALATLTVVGSHHQDRKILRLRGEPFRDWLAQTSAIPFAAILAGRQRLAWNELPLAPIVVGVLLAFEVRRVHAGIFAHHGAWVVLAVVGGAVSIGLATALNARRDRLRRGTAPRHTAPVV